MLKFEECLGKRMPLKIFRISKTMKAPKIPPKKQVKKWCGCLILPVIKAKNGSISKTTLPKRNAVKSTNLKDSIPKNNPGPK